MNCELKPLLLVVACLSAITMPMVGSAAQRSSSLGAAHSQSFRPASSVQTLRAPQLSASGPSSAFNLGSASGLGRRMQSPGRVQGNAVQPLRQFVPNVSINRVPSTPATPQIRPNAIRPIDPPVLSATPAEIEPNSLGQASLPAGIGKVDGKLSPGAQTLVQNLAKKDQILKLKKDFLGNPAKIGLGDLPKLQEAKQYATKSLLLGPKCAWWVHWYYHCYWHHSHSWCWHHWHPYHFHVIHYHAGYSYYFGAELFAVPGIGLGVASVNPGSPAERAGLEVGDMIISANGQPLQALNSNAVMRHVIRTSGGVLNMEVLRETTDESILMTALLRRVYHYSY